MATMVQQLKARWFEWIPGWLPICATICFGAWWVGQYTQSINDRLSALEKQVMAIQDYIRTQHSSTYVLPPELSPSQPVQDAAASRRVAQ